jgi:hypothetical protein
MVAPKDEHLALSSGIGLAGIAISHFYEAGYSAFYDFKEEIIDSIIKPSKITAVHYYLSYFQDVYEDIHKIKGSVDELDYLYDFLVRTLKDVNLFPDLPSPNFTDCADQWHENCTCKKIVQQWEIYVKENANMINELIIHSAFQVIFLDRKFLHDFHMELAEFIEDHMDDIRDSYPDKITAKYRIERAYFPIWLKNAVYHRDKGTCTICRCDLTNLVRTQNTIHIDHIVPLDIYGSNDASNFQLLCETCNTSKGARSSETSSMNVPYWNL